MNTTQWANMLKVCSYSGGKDSTATVILAHEHNEPLDIILFSEVMFDDNTSGELPEHIDFIKNKAFPLFESWGYKCEIVHSKYNFYDHVFNHVVTKSAKEERNGKKHGFPIAGLCKVNSQCKIAPIRQWYKEHPCITYVGIAKDEPKRLARLKENQISLLEEYNYTEQMAYELCKQYDLLSPVYDFVKRGGCWFCPNMREGEIKHLRENHRELYDILLKLEDDPNLTTAKWLNHGSTTIHEYEKIFSLQDSQVRWF